MLGGARFGHQCRLARAFLALLQEEAPQSQCTALPEWRQPVIV